MNIKMLKRNAFHEWNIWQDICDEALKENNAAKFKRAYRLSEFWMRRFQRQLLNGADPISLVGL